MAWSSKRRKVYGGGVGGIVLGDGRLVVGWVKNGCADGSTPCSSRRMNVGDTAAWTSWEGSLAAQRAFRGIRKQSKASCDARHDSRKTLHVMATLIRPTDNNKHADFRLSRICKSGASARHRGV